MRCVWVCVLCGACEGGEVGEVGEVCVEPDECWMGMRSVGWLLG